jgi:hypothetical protein
LQAYAGTQYSWQHKGTSYFLPQDTKPDFTNPNHQQPPTFYVDNFPNVKGEQYPTTGEYDLMKYYNSNTISPTNPYRGVNFFVASEDEVLGMLWLIKSKLNYET